LNELVKDLVKDGHEVAVLTGEPNYPSGEILESYQNNPSEYSSYFGAEIIRTKLRPRKSGGLNLVLNYLSFVFSSCLTVKRRLSKRKFDAVFVFQSSPVTVTLPALLYKRITGTPVILWVQDLWPDTLSAVGFTDSKLILGAVGKLVSFIYKRCDLILCQSTHFIKNIAIYNHTNTPTGYLPNWADDVFSQPPTCSTPTYEKVEGYFDILFAGNIGDAQDFPSILDAAEKIKGRKIRIVVVGVGSLYEWVEQQISERGLEGVVVLLGRHAIECMPSFYSKADALLAALAKKEIFTMTIPSKIQTYLAAGKPVIVMLDGVGAEVINEAQCGIACGSGDAAALAASMISLSELDKGKLLEMGASGKRYYHENFEKNMLREKLVGMLQNKVTP
jgi:glycosyltransferase involved in cell wall biosynthesis